MGQIARFREDLRRVAMIGEGFVEDQAGLGVAILMVKLFEAVVGGTGTWQATCR
jgi:hypothetical protein